MPTQLSGGTLGLKFMQRAAAKKAAAAGAAPAPADVEQSKPSSFSTPVQPEPEAEDTPFPVASTSKLPRARRPMVTTEASFLAFPILSNAYGASTSTIGSNANGRMTFGNQPEKEEEPDNEEDERSTEEEVTTQRIRQEKPKREFRKPAGMEDLPPPIRKRKSEPVQADEVESQSADENFADDMIAEARQRRKAPAAVETNASSGDAGKKKKRKKVNNEA